MDTHGRHVHVHVRMCIRAPVHFMLLRAAGSATRAYGSACGRVSLVGVRY